MKIATLRRRGFTTEEAMVLLRIHTKGLQYQSRLHDKAVAAGKLPDRSELMHRTLCRALAGIIIK